jgi:hypothetical protein
MERYTSGEAKIPFAPPKKPSLQRSKVKHDGDGRFTASLMEEDEQKFQQNKALLESMSDKLRAADSALNMLLGSKQEILCILPSIAHQKMVAGVTPRDESEASADKPSTSCTLEDDINKLRTQIHSLLSTSVDIKNSPVFKRFLARLTKTFEQTNQLIQESKLCIYNKETAIAIAAADEELRHSRISEAISLCTDYKSKKDALSFPSTIFFKPAPTRLGAIELIESIAQLLQDELSPLRENLARFAQHIFDAPHTPTIEEVHTAAKALIDHTQASGLIIEGVYLYVMNDIQEDYKKGWLMTDPERSELFKLLSASIKSNSDEECLKRLKALEGFMLSHPGREKIQCGIQKHSEILAGTITLLKQCTHHNGDTQQMAAP